MENIDRLQLAQEWAAFDGTWTEFLYTKGLTSTLKPSKSPSKQAIARRRYQRKYYRKHRKQMLIKQCEYRRKRKRSDVAQLKRRVKIAGNSG